MSTPLLNAPNNEKVDNIGQLDDMCPRDSEWNDIIQGFKEIAESNRAAFEKYVKEQQLLESLNL